MRTAWHSAPGVSMPQRLSKAFPGKRGRVEKRSDATIANFGGARPNDDLLSGSNGINADTAFVISVP
ncbi:hypothetical protein KCP73_08365 [Salmonella enterica subsp. enterica]|nr:hypothetical protein KCP73_08365 [Salmonella enterica subsp. enterica]